MAQNNFDSRYAFLTGSIRAQEASGLSGDMVREILKSTSVKDGMEVLKKSFYQDFFRESGSSENIDALIHWRRENLQQFLGKHSYHRNLIRLIKIGYDYHNLKVLLKDKIFETDNRGLLVPWGDLDTRDLAGIMESETYELLPGMIQDALSSAIEIYFLHKRPVLLDLVMDRCMFEHAMHLCGNLESPIIEDFWRLKIDLINIQTLLRAKNYRDIAALDQWLFADGGFISKLFFKDSLNGPGEALLTLQDRDDLGPVISSLGESEENPLAIERECDNILMRYLREFRFILWGVETVFIYAEEVEQELKILGLLFSGIKAGFSIDMIKKRLPEPFGG